ncbi:reverse transcriptase domain-containing protein, partial [Tanacetum coccineum]
KKYVVEILERAGMVNCNPSRTPVDTESKLGATGDIVSDPTLYRSLAGSLQYLTFTRPDISYAVQQLFSSSTTDLVAYSDADWVGCPTTRRSTFGYCVFFCNNLLSWSSKRQPTLSRSNAEAEYRDVANVVAETAVYLSCNPVQHQRTKHIEIDIHFVQDLVAAGQDNYESLQYRPHLGPKDTETLRGSFNEFTWYKNEALYTRIAAYSDQTRPNLTFVSTSWRHPWDPTLGITLTRMSAMANATPIVTTVTKTANKEKAPDAAPRVNILDFCEENYEDILPIIMEKARQNSPTRFHPERSRTRDREKRDDRKVFNRLSRQRKSVHERLSDTYSLSATKSGPSRTDSRDPSHSRGHSLSREHPRFEDHLWGVEELYGDTYSQRTRTKYRDRSCGGDRFRSVKRWRESESLSSRGSESSTSNRGHWKSRTKRLKLIDEDDLIVERWAMPTWCHMFNSTLIGAARVWFDELPPKSINGYKALKAAFLAYFMQQKKYVKDPVEIHNIKQRDGETIQDFMERFKVETERMKGAPECMRISGFMHGVNNPELTKRLNEYVPKTMEEMMTVTTAFIQGEYAAASKKKGHSPWKSQDQSKRHAPERKSDF